MKPRQSPTASIRFFNFIHSILRPIMPVLLAGTLIESLATTAIICNWLSTSHPFYPILSAAGSAPFYYLPVLLAYSLAHRMECNRPLSILVSVIFLHPTLSAWLAEAGSDTSALSVRGAVYSGKVVPILTAVLLIKALQPITCRWIPSGARKLLQPLVTLAVVLPVILCIVGPICRVASHLFAYGLHQLYDRANWAATFLLSLSTPILLLLGESYLPTAAEDHLMWSIALFSVNAALFGTMIARLICEKKPSKRQIAIGEGIGTLVGLPRSAIYGSLLLGKNILWSVSIAAGLGGLCCALSGAFSSELTPSFFALFASLTEITSVEIQPRSTRALLWSILLFLLIATLGFMLSLLLSSRKKHHSAEADPSDRKSAPALPFSALKSPITVFSPLSGKVIPLCQMKDPAFAAGIMGQGCAVLPSFGKVYAPSDGRVTSVSPLGNKLHFTCTDGIQLLIQVGCTVPSSAQQHFSACCREGDTVQKGDLLLSFDADALRKTGIDLTTALLVINAECYGELSFTGESRVSTGDRLLTLTPAE